VAGVADKDSIPKNQVGLPAEQGIRKNSDCIFLLGVVRIKLSDDASLRLQDRKVSRGRNRGRGEIQSPNAVLYRPQHSIRVVSLILIDNDHFQMGIRLAEN
jgi:hypothetical protein